MADSAVAATPDAISARRVGKVVLEAMSIRPEGSTAFANVAQHRLEGDGAGAMLGALTREVDPHLVEAVEHGDARLRMPLALGAEACSLALAPDSDRLEPAVRARR
jgi:hypothetical protein